MPLILPGILSLAQHIQTLRTDPESYRPKCCPCGHAKVWCHGCYTRETNPGDLSQSCLSVQIPRFYCPECHKTCSVLPECIPPRSWYLWSVRQVIFLLLLAGNSLDVTYNTNGIYPCRETISRWWSRLHACHQTYSFHLCPRFPCLGRYAEFNGFWRKLLELCPLSEAMLLLHQEGAPVP